MLSGIKPGMTIKAEAFFLRHHVQANRVTKRITHVSLLGYHLMLDVHGCNEQIADSNHVIAFCDELVEDIEM